MTANIVIRRNLGFIQKALESVNVVLILFAHKIRKEMQILYQIEFCEQAAIVLMKLTFQIKAEHSVKHRREFS